MAAESSLPSGFGTRPWLVQVTRGERQTFVDSSDGSSHATVVPEMQGKTCLGCIHNGDWLLMLDESTFECFLLHLSDDDDDDPSKKIPLPPLQEPVEFIQTCALLGASPADPDCAVVVAIKREVGVVEVERFLLHCRSGSCSDWTRLESPDLSFPNLMISHRGEIYYFGASETLLVIGGDGDGTVRARLIGTLSGAKEHLDREAMYYVVESSGDLFVVVTEKFGVFLDDSTVTSIAVYRVDLESMMWTRVHNIGHDRAFLVSGHYGFSVPVDPGARCLVPQETILPRPTKPWCRAFWAVPPSAAVVKETELLRSDPLGPEAEENCESIFSLEEEAATSCNTRPWHDLPLELLELVVSKVSLVDRLRFPAVCKSWSMVSNPVEHAKVWPWLMHCSGRDGVCKFFDPLRCQEYTKWVDTFEMSEIEGEHDRHIFRSSKDGWVAVSTAVEIDDIYIINPFTGDIVEVAMLERKYHFMGMSWSSIDPASPDCVFFGVDSRHDGKAVGVLTCRHNENDWTEQHLEYYEGAPFPVAYANPVFFNDKFYCLSRMGNLGTLDPTNDTWTILEKPKPIHMEMKLIDDDHEGTEFCNLVEVGGELVCVFVRNANEPPQVFKLNEEEMVWMEVQDIGGSTLFLDFRVSYSMVLPEAGHGNKIYFPRYSDNGK
ncbi:hypothetical protein QYE76_026257 [Lolium multiflorum]|uniref:F-box domain-containing protein n=1 Tax=Lolium multiflorum TaxID=4521 RepID=A0AAD8RH62_LOLMU|nr:hypothetical protein QYE76_026257 [Lolium multiflorum]